MKRRVPLHQSMGFTTVEEGATKGATLGVNLYDQNGNVISSLGSGQAATPASAPAWGEITGTLSDQSDLQAAIDAKGFKNLPKVTAALEVGKCLSITSGITINTGTEGDICSVYNNSGSSVTLTQGGSLTLRVAGTATTGNYSLPQRGLVTIWWHSATEAIIL